MIIAIFQRRACCSTKDVSGFEAPDHVLGSSFGLLQSSLCSGGLFGEGTFILPSASASQSKLLGFLAHLSQALIPFQ